MKISSGKCKFHARVNRYHKRPLYGGNVPHSIRRVIRAGLLQKIDKDSLIALVATLEPDTKNNPDDSTLSSTEMAQMHVESIMEGNYTEIQLLDSTFWGDNSGIRKNGRKYIRPKNTKKQEVDEDVSVDDCDPSSEYEVTPVELPHNKYNKIDANAAAPPARRGRKRRRRPRSPLTTSTAATQTAGTMPSPDAVTSSSPRPSPSDARTASSVATAGFVGAQAAATPTPAHGTGPAAAAPAGAPSAGVTLASDFGPPPVPRGGVGGAADAAAYPVDEPAPRGSASVDDGGDAPPSLAMDAPPRGTALVAYTGVGAAALLRWAPVAAAIEENDHQFFPFWEGMIAPRIGLGWPPCEVDALSDHEAQAVIDRLHEFAAVFQMRVDSSVMAGCRSNNKMALDIKISQMKKITRSNLSRFVEIMNDQSKKYTQIVD